MPSPERFLEGLSPSQQAAVRIIDGPLLILAGPGSGKTRVVTHRIAYMLASGVHPRNVLALTFTNKAAEEMASRVTQLVPGARVWSGTFHKFCARLLRRYAEHAGLRPNYTIYDTDDSRKLLKEAVEKAIPDLTHHTVDQIANAISHAKNQLLGPGDYQAKQGSTLGQVVAKVYPLYQEMLTGANAVDFDDLLMLTAFLLKAEPTLREQLDAHHRYIMVDEYQDTNLAQYAIVRGLSIDHTNLAVTGDPDQSIYGWRGASIRNILEFERDYPAAQTVRLEQNYRSTKSILAVADALIVHNTKRKHKDLYTHNDDGNPVKLVTYPSHRDEAEQIARDMRRRIDSGRRPSEMALFYRTNALSRTFEHALREQQIPYQIVRGLEFYQRKEIKDVLAYLQLIVNPANRIALTRIINTPARGIGKTTVHRLLDEADRRHVPPLEVAQDRAFQTSLGKRAATALARFAEMIGFLSRPEERPIELIVREVIERSGYRDALLTGGTEEDLERLANIEELSTAAREFAEGEPPEEPGDSVLESFLERVSLYSDTDKFDPDLPRVTLMTLHAAKGLEFPVVYIVAVEEGMLPHERSRDNPDQLEEERRLLFVGITRAKEELQLSLANYRAFRGGQFPTIPSQFLMELPRGEMEILEPEARAYARFGLNEFSQLGSEDDYSQLDGEVSDDRLAAQTDHAADVLSSVEMSRAARGTTKRRDDGLTLVPEGDGTPAPESAPSLTTPKARIEAADLFREGVGVAHPQYGVGRVIGATGQGPKRNVTVRFESDGRLQTFRLAFSPLTLRS